GSIETDVLLVNDELYVAHEAVEINKERTLDDLYLKPLQTLIKENEGFPYPDPKAKLLFLIDLKTNGDTTLPVLVRKLAKYQDLIKNKNIQFVISGERPQPNLWDYYPDYIYFDGTPGVNYTAMQLKRVGFFSTNFQNFTKWNGTGKLPQVEETKMRQAIDSVHQLNKKWRFWATPDNVNSWKTLMNLGVDYIGTDDVNGLTTFLKKVPAK
ncbi:MAG: alkaline phosphatase, partial [Bacteroidota bacterium]|nr:alkaline phosphatase [Bacteroidota bacterium]